MISLKIQVQDSNLRLGIKKYNINQLVFTSCKNHEQIQQKSGTFLEYKVL